eukprot:TRINITY_DN16944_c0_g1_i2.p1 TRINITY_DN16944_c0_g1~~TRINITY_DN16944_c0_g1_i2.p1  ORF type:complete len:219 (+),score=56.19 TRINITY_DN16944_c0_g1_i2:40-657(+)
MAFPPNNFNTGFFMNNDTGAPSPSAPATAATPGTPGEEGKRQNTSLTPVTCRQILRAEKGSGEVFRVEGKVLQQVTLVAKLEDWKLAEDGREILMTVTDGTGTLQITMFGTEFLSQLEEWRQTRYEMKDQKSYVRIYGHVRTWKKGISIIAFKANFCEEFFAELLHHHRAQPKPESAPVTGCRDVVQAMVGSVWCRVKSPGMVHP